MVDIQDIVELNVRPNHVEADTQIYLHPPAFPNLVVRALLFMVLIRKFVTGIASTPFLSRSQLYFYTGKDASL